MKSFFCVSVEDVQHIALKKIGRNLTDEKNIVKMRKDFNLFKQEVNWITFLK